ncbi:MAG: DUF3008 family protein [Tannerellaceae bacterium]|nr:DUF3008 family protein [Tannerellaceae bacterium]MCD8264198.1 DUF3008 family protein [Tannerellaceae bacterium]
MPVKSEKQRELMGAALAYKRGESKTSSEEIRKVADSMSESELEDFASKPENKRKKG